jgi:hypothetical protein
MFISRSAFFSSLILLTALSQACKPPVKKEGSSKVVLDYSSSISKADSCWAIMMLSDDNKISNMQRLAKELMLVDGSDSLALEKIKSSIEQLPGQRYNRISMGAKGSIDRYDSLCTAALSSLRKEVSKNPNAVQFQIVNQLLSEVGQADDSVLFYRKEYDRCAEKLNLLLKNHGKVISAEIPEADSIKAFPIFRLVP